MMNSPTHMRPLVSSRNPGLQMHLKLPSSLIHSPFRHMFLIRHSSWSVNEQKQFDSLIAVLLVKIKRTNNKLAKQSGHFRQQMLLFRSQRLQICILAHSLTKQQAPLFKLVQKKRFCCSSNKNYRYTVYWPFIKGPIY